MKTFNFALQSIITIALSLGLLVMVGCSKSDPTSTPDPAAGHTEDDGHDHSAHAHPTEGPHHGSLIELGNEEYHAELIHDETSGIVTIYLLDSSAMNTVAIDATELLVNLSHDGSAEQFALTASPEPSDPQGKSSRFVSSGAELGSDLDHEGIEAQLVVTINGKQYRGAIHHDHDHEGHDHAGHDDHDHAGHDHDDHEGHDH